MDWVPFLTFVVSRVNTTSGIRYGDDRIIAMISFAGEVDGIKGGDNTYGLTTDQLTVFYRDVQNFWNGAAPHQLLTAGGLSQLDWDSGIAWPAIFSLPHNDVVALHVYTSGDAAVTVPAVARFSQGIGRPWMIEELVFLPIFRMQSEPGGTHECTTWPRATGSRYWAVECGASGGGHL